ncbi:MAG: hypothetical protein ACK4PR_08155 [Gammaproteobacteria bacterium]
MKTCLCILASLLFSTWAYASNIYTCSNNGQHVSFKNNTLVLTGKNNTQYFYKLTNTSQQVFWLDMAVHPDTASAGWGSQIHPGHYSIIAMTKPSFAMSCYALDKNYQTHILNCQTVLSVCQLKSTPQRDGKPAPSGSYWVFEDQSP